MTATRPPRARAASRRTRPHPAFVRRRRAVRGLPSRPQMLAAAGVALAAGLAGYWLATGPVLSVHGVRVTGDTHPDAAALRQAVAHAAERGGSLLSPPLGAIRRQALRSPWVADVTVQRDWPVGLVVEITPAQPMAVGVPDHGAPVLINARGQVMGPAPARGGLPRIRLGATAPAAGAPIGPGPAAALLFVRASTAGTAAHMRGLRIQRGQLVGTLTSGPDLQLGPPVKLRQKALAVQAVLNALTPDETRKATYINVVVPENPAVGGLEPIAAPVVTKPAPTTSTGTGTSTTTQTGTGTATPGTGGTPAGTQDTTGTGGTSGTTTGTSGTPATGTSGQGTTGTPTAGTSGTPSGGTSAPPSSGQATQSPASGGGQLRSPAQSSGGTSQPPAPTGRGQTSPSTGQ
ncbi:MAG: FtsQ-type POTRA domain-containing protein [Thermoleophilia bacterium]